MQDDISERIRNLQKAEAEHSTRLAQLTGQRDQILSQLKEQFDVDSLEAAQAKLEKLRKGIAKRETVIRDLLDKLEAALDG